MLILQVPRHVDHEQRFFQRKLFVVVLNVMGVAVAVPQFGNAPEALLAELINFLHSCSTTKPWPSFSEAAMEWHQPTADPSSQIVFTAGGVGFTGMSSVAPCCVQALRFSL